MPEDNQRPMLATDSVVVMGIDQLVPHLNTEGWAQITLADDQWHTLEVALLGPLDVEHRQAVCEAIGYFIHSLRLKNIILTPRQYANKLQDRLTEILAAAENVLTMILPSAPRPADIPQVSSKEAKAVLGGRDTLWVDAAAASRTTPDGSEVWFVEDHIRALLHVNAPAATSAAHEGLMRLVHFLGAMRTDIEQLPRNIAGADGNYELNLLLVDLLRVAQAAGDNLELVGHPIRDKVMGSTVNANPAYLFVEEALRMILDASDSLVAGLNLPEKAATELLTLIRKNLVREPGTLIDPMDAAKSVILAGSKE